MSHQARTGRRSRLGLCAAGAALAVLLAAFVVLSAQEPARESFITPGNAQPVQLSANEITHWSDAAGRRAFVVKGAVAISQGTMTLRMPQGVVWIDEAGQARTRVYQLEVYGEGPLEILKDGQSRIVRQGLFQLATQADVRINAYGGKAAEKALPGDNLYRRAVAFKEPPPAATPAPGAIQLVGGQMPAPAPPAPVLAPVPGMEPLELPLPAPQPPAPQPAAPQPPAPQPPEPMLPVPAPFPPGEPVQSISNKAAAPSPLAPLAADTLPVKQESPAPIQPVQGPADEIFPQPKPPVAPPVTLGAPQTVSPLPGATPTKIASPGSPRSISIRPRALVGSQFRSFPGPNGETAYVYTGGVILSINNPGEKKGMLDIEGDRLVVWTKGGAQDLMFGPQGKQDGSKSFEFYIAGNVELRFLSAKGETEVLRATELYYDVNRNVAVAHQADLEMKQGKIPNPIHIRSPEIWQLNEKTFEATTPDMFATILPSDPGLLIHFTKTTIEEKDVPRTNIFGFPVNDPKTGKPIVDKQRILTGTNMVTWLEGVPINYFPYIHAPVEDPLGPLDSIAYNYNHVLGFQLYTTWDIYQLLGIVRPTGYRWQLYADYLSARGPGLGTDFKFMDTNPFGIPAKVDGEIKAWGLHDQRTYDTLGGDRGKFLWIDPMTFTNIDHPAYRGRFLQMLNVQELPAGFMVQDRISIISDQNFLEQFYLPESVNGLDQQTYLWVKQQQQNWAWTALTEVRTRNWVTETNWLPKFDGWLLGATPFDNLFGETFLDRIVYNAHASAGYAQLMPTNRPPYAWMPTDVRVDTGRFDFFQEASLPFYAGPVKVVPYIVTDLAWYTQDATGRAGVVYDQPPNMYVDAIVPAPGGQERGRAYGAGGLRTSIPFSKLYPDVQSDFFNVNGIYHKSVLSTNYYNAYSSTSLFYFPQLDRLDDDTSELSQRYSRVFNYFVNPSNANLLANSPLFNPQLYALRRLVDTRTDTLDSMDVLQMDLRQRLQTKRGMPGSQHVIDWMTFEVSASLFPQPTRDNFGNHWGIVEYDWLWNVGDRTALTVNGWFEPVQNGPRVFDIGAIFNRPDTTNFLIGYRQLDPLKSKAVIGAVTYPFSAKYALTASTTWDFGINNHTYTFMLTRLGTDLQISLGVSYVSILNNFGVNLQIIPNLFGAGRTVSPGVPLMTNAPLSATNQGR